MLTKEDIVKAKDLPHEDINVPEWGGTVRVRTMTGTERDAFEASVYETTGNEVKMNRNDFRAKLLARVIIGEDGNRLFNDKEISVLGAKSSKALNRLFEVAQELNGMSGAEREKIEKK